MIAGGVSVLTSSPRNLAADRDDARLDPLGVGQKLSSDGRVRAVGADDKVSGGSRSIGEARRHPSVRAVLEGYELLAETRHIVEPLQQYATQTPRPIGRSASSWRRSMFGRSRASNRFNR